jgi:hypothetical protein
MVTGALTARIHLDPDGDHFTVEHVQDVAPILERNAALRAEPQKSDWGRHIASIPNVVLVRWMNEDGVNVLGMSSAEWGKYIRRKLDDPDWRHLRVDK